MKVFAHVGFDPNAIPYYRIGVPCSAMADLELADFAFDDEDREVDDADRWAAMLLSDSYYGCFPVTQRRFQSFAPFVGVRPDEETGQIPPSTILDLDDDMWNIHPTNTSYVAWGYKDLDGKELAPGGKIYVELPDGTIEPIWEDEKPYNENGDVYSLQVAKQNIRMANGLLKSASGVVTTSEYLKQRIQDESGAEHVHVYPNCINFGHYDKVELREHPDEVRIMWRGGSSHFLDVAEVAGSLGRVLAKYPHAKFLLFGQDFPYLESKFNPEQFEYVHWVPFERYRLRLATLNHDIAICPISDTVFNAGKSAISWYENTAICKPAACLATNHGPYAREIEDGVTGLLYKGAQEFEEKLSQLIEDASLRKLVTSNSVDWLHENRDVYKHAPALYEFVEESHSRYLEQRRKFHVHSHSVLAASTEPVDVDAGCEADRAGLGVAN